ncbi:hypothetical protein FQA39_LY05657 [Lamprigera yunnana]|nr:hypothetical protein FQA39_LY05657 [Lamprigera yunnana]
MYGTIFLGQIVYKKELAVGQYGSPKDYHKKIRSVDGDTMKIVTCHNHAAQAASRADVALVTEVKERVTTTHKRPQHIIANAIAEAHVDVVVLPKKDFIKKTICLSRGDEEAPELSKNVE